MVFRDFIRRARDTVDNTSELQSSEPPKRGWPHRPSDSLPDITQQAIDVLLLSAHSNGEIDGIGYWQSANVYTAILHHDIWASAARDHPNFRNLQFVRGQVSNVLHRHRDCVNEFCDDTLWWGFVALLLYKATKDSIYLHHCVQIHKHVSRFVLPPGSRDARGHDVSGAAMWKSTSDCSEVNSITTGLWAEYCGELALLAASHPSRLPPSRALLAQATAGVDFIFRHLYDPNENVAFDTLKLDSGEIVEWTFTYTTGQLMAACMAIHKFSQVAGQGHTGRETELFQKSISISRAAMTRSQWIEGPDSIAPGVLTEYGAYGPEKKQAWENDDAVGFKSVLVRSLAKLFEYVKAILESEGSQVLYGCGRKDLQDLCAEIRTFIEKTYHSLQVNCTNGIGQYGPWWAGPMDMSTCHSQMAVLDVMAAMRLLNP